MGVLDQHELALGSGVEGLDGHGERGGLRCGLLLDAKGWVTSHDHHLALHN